jgi:hypothetical protein
LQSIEAVEAPEWALSNAGPRARLEFECRLLDNFDGDQLY